MSISVDKSGVISGGTINEIVLDVVEGTPIRDLKQIDMKIGASDALPVKVGSAGTAQLSISGEATASLIPISSGDGGDAVKKQTLSDAGVGDFFDGGNNAGEVLLVLDLGARADASAKLPVKYQVLSGDVTLAAGVDAGYLYARSFKDTTTIGDAALDFFGNIALPATLGRPLREDEHLVFDFGGYAKFGASVSAGWQMAGAQDLTIGKLGAAEKYAFSVIGKVGVSAQIAGRFRIAVAPAPDKANWARVTVSKNDQRELGIAADVIAGANFTQQGFPGSAKEFLEAAIGTRAKSWLAYFAAAEDWTDPATAKKKLDTLAQSFVEKWSGKLFEELDHAGLGKALDELQKAIQSYNQLGDRAVALFDRYYDPIAKQLESRIADALEAVTKINDWDELKNRLLDTDLFEVLDTLGGGQIAAALNSGEAKAKAELDAIKAKAAAILDSVRNDAHAELKKLIATAKQEFGLDPLIAKLDSIGKLADVKASADKKAIGFAERLIDKALADLHGTELEKAATKLHEILTNIEKFSETWYGKFVAALSQSFSFQVHAEYNRSSNRAAMLVFDVDLTSAEGRSVLHKAAAGDFSAAFDANPAVVAIQQGTFSRRLASQRAVAINVIGWNQRAWKFNSVRDLVVQSDQNLTQGPNGLVVTTDTSLSVQNVRQKNNEKMISTFMLLFAGQTQAAGGRKFDGQDFLIDALQSAGASYTLAITDEHTTKDELGQYLNLANSLGFAVADPAGAIARMLPNDGGNFGKVQIDYDVRFTPDGIAAAIGQQLTGEQVRFIARLIVLTNALADFHQNATRAWAYWSDSTFADWKHVNDIGWPDLHTGPFAVKPSPIDGSRPSPTVNPDRMQRVYIQLLYRAENAMIAALDELRGIRAPISNADLTKKLNDVGKKFGLFDDLDGGDNTWFAVFDQLVKLAGVPGSRNSTLKITATLKGKTITTGLIA